ncbi:MAG: hypothetical protein K2X81_04330 [Candidatus Obscuribacterales bacterium]|nr:hypothetical protein [Candidatus Obscuribacterales bacterium]
MYRLDSKAVVLVFILLLPTLQSAIADPKISRLGMFDRDQVFLNAKDQMEASETTLLGKRLAIDKEYKKGVPQLDNLPSESRKDLQIELEKLMRQESMIEMQRECFIFDTVKAAIKQAASEMDVDFLLAKRVSIKDKQ